mgnify:CR=1 FL=1
MIKNPNDIIGNKYNKLTVKKYLGFKVYGHGKNQRKFYFYKCQCECGNCVIVRRNELVKIIRTQCKTCAYKKINPEDIIEKRFGKLTVIEHVENRNGFHFYKCQCDCGNTTIVSRSNLLGNKTSSCGCYKKQRIKESHTTHGMSNTRFFGIWHGMKNRCYNSNSENYKDYGGRGITVCNRWLESFENFRDDMYDEYIEKSKIYGEENVSIDRIDNNKNYCKENCRWTTLIEQANNKRSNHYIEINDELYTLKNAWRRYGVYNVGYNTVKSRISRGIDPYEAITTPVEDKYQKDIIPIEFFDPENPPKEYINAKEMIKFIDK